jgi:hypothetical protein
MPAPPRDPVRFAPVFVLAPARSYSSVISMMLGQHPDLAGLPELKVFAYPTISELEASLPRFWIERGVTHRAPGLVRAIAEIIFGGQTLESLAEARVWLHKKSAWSGADVLDCLLAKLQPRIGVEKSPENVETVAALKRVAAAYPRARYLHLTRHPVATQRSIQQHLDRMAPGRGQLGQPMSGIAAWCETHRLILRFAAALPADRYCRVRSEDVLNDTEPNLTAIAGWLGVRIDAAALEAMIHPERSPFAGFAPAASGAAGGNDPAFLRDPVPHRVQMPQTLEPPAGWSAKPLVWGRVVDLANYLGYS